MPTLQQWSPDDTVAEPVALDTDAAWDALKARYTEGRVSPQFDRVVEILRANGAVAVIIERRYIDIDWRSEHSNFYSTTFARFPSVCQRLHFFSSALPADLGDLSVVAASYLGYSVMRPLAWAPVGRTMIKPPPELDGAIQCAATETVDVLGWPMDVRSMPFTSQDGQFLRCAHAAIWMAAHLGHLRQGLPRRTPAEIQAATHGGLIVGRQVPSEGPSVHQMLGALTALGMSPAQLNLPETPTDETAAGWQLSLFGIVCRYINSNLPPIVVSRMHAWVVVAYLRSATPGAPPLTLFRHDDAAGPYIMVADPWHEPNIAHTWVSALLPLPPKIYMTAERAEAVGRWWFSTHIASGSVGAGLMDARANDELTYLTYGLSGRDYKHGLAHRPGVDPALAREYRLSAWPRNIWVVEVIDRRLRNAGLPAVLGEVIIDPTANQTPTADDPGILATHASGRFYAEGPDLRTVRDVAVADNPYESGRPL